MRADGDFWDARDILNWSGIIFIRGHRLAALSAVFRPPILHDFFRGPEQPMGVLFQFTKGRRGKMFVGILSRLAERFEQASRDQNRDGVRRKTKEPGGFFRRQTRW